MRCPQSIQDQEVSDMKHVQFFNDFLEDEVTSTNHDWIV